VEHVTLKDLGKRGLVVRAVDRRDPVTAGETVALSELHNPFTYPTDDDSQQFRTIARSTSSGTPSDSV
jgi:hypothetical protein